MQRILAAGVAGVLFVFSSVDLTAQREWYVSAANGKGRKGTLEQPSKDLGTIASKLEAGDTIYIAAGHYTGRGDNGHDAISVPVSIYGGFSEDFKTRDPWGEHQTVLTGDNLSKNFEGRARLEILCNKVRGNTEHPILVDGLIIDNGGRNQYVGEGDAELKRRYSPQTGANASPDSPGIAIWGHDGGRITVQNCIVANCGPAGRRGSLEIKGVRDTHCTIQNNLVINNTSGIACLAAFHPRDGKGGPVFEVTNNTVLFTWKFDPIATHGGDGIRCEDVAIVAANNVFAYGDYYGVNNCSGSDSVNLTLINNLFSGNLMADYNEWDTKIAIDDVEDDAEKLGDDTQDNTSAQIDAAVAASWAEKYAARNVIDRMKAEDSVQPLDNFQNDLRRMLGLPLDGGTLDVGSAVWMHRFPLEDAVRIARTQIQGRGCQNPVAGDLAMPPGK